MPTALAKPWPSGPVVVSIPRAWPIFRMAGGARPELAEILDVLERHVLIAGEIEQGIEQHRAMAGRQHEAVAVWPVRRRGIEFQEPGEQHRREIGRPHRQPGMTGIGLLDRIHGQGPNGVGHFLDCAHPSTLLWQDGAIHSIATPTVNALLAGRFQPAARPDRSRPPIFAGSWMWKSPRRATLRLRRRWREPNLPPREQR